MREKEVILRKIFNFIHTDSKFIQTRKQKKILEEFTPTKVFIHKGSEFTRLQYFALKLNHVSNYYYLRGKMSGDHIYFSTVNLMLKFLCLNS